MKRKQNKQIRKKTEPTITQMLNALMDNCQKGCDDCCFLDKDNLSCEMMDASETKIKRFYNKLKGGK